MRTPFMNLFRQALPDIVAVVFFALLSCAYFFPADMEGRILSQHDSVAGVGAGKEAKDYLERTGERTRWTNALFGGMPTYQMSPSYDSTEPLRRIERVYRLGLPGDAALLFIMLAGFYMLMRAFGCRADLAALGGVAWAFSSYFFILIAAGHIWKFVTLAYIPPTLAGIVWTYRGRRLWGSVVTALFTALQILSNHIQMSYYFCGVIFLLILAFGVEAWRRGTMRRFVMSTLVVGASALVGVTANLSNLYHTYEYSKETMRGKSELVKPDTGNQTRSGLDRDYITHWSYGIGESFSLLVPNVKGGASNRGDRPLLMSDSETAMKKADPTYAPLYSQLTQYWGEQPGTSGPVYVGAFVLMLFVLGLFILRGPVKWALLLATVFSLLLSWGKNLMPLTDLFLDYVPMYDKFRAVSSILVVAELTIPVLAILVLRELIIRPDIVRRQKRAVWGAFALTGGVALLFALLPSVCFPSYVSSMERAALEASNLGEHLVPILSNLTEMRVAMFTADAWRSVLIVCIGMALLLLYGHKRIGSRALVALAGVLCLVDMWQVNKRYLSDEMFVEPSAREAAYHASEADNYIFRQDSTLDYRVLNMASNTFNENETSYWHKSIGGYHAAKLRRYQELIDAHILPEMQRLYKDIAEKGGETDSLDASRFPVLNMLNTRWFLFPGRDGAAIPLYNPHALGNAWFVDEVKPVANANEEIEALRRIDPRHTAIVDSRFTALNKGAMPDDSTRTIRLTAYEPNRLTYEVDSQEGGTAVFAEVYYPGWQATVDGSEAPHGRANYILRAMHLPAGRHTVVFSFDPVSLSVTEAAATGALSLMAAGVIAALWMTVRKIRGK